MRLSVHLYSKKCHHLNTISADQTSSKQKNALQWKSRQSNEQSRSNFTQTYLRQVGLHQLHFTPIIFTLRGTKTELTTNATDADGVDALTDICLNTTPSCTYGFSQMSMFQRTRSQPAKQYRGRLWLWTSRRSTCKMSMNWCNLEGSLFFRHTCSMCVISVTLHASFYTDTWPCKCLVHLHVIFLHHQLAFHASSLADGRSEDDRICLSAKK